MRQKPRYWPILKQSKKGDKLRVMGYLGYEDPSKIIIGMETNPVEIRNLSLEEKVNKSYAPSASPITV